jgi:hypothetical protein
MSEILRFVLFIIGKRQKYDGRTIIVVGHSISSLPVLFMAFFAIRLVSLQVVV